MISEQVKKLREYADGYKRADFGVDGIVKALYQAADTIESLSAELQAANEELKCWHTDHINEKIKNPFAWTSTLICHNCDHKDEYIEELEAANMERPAEDCGGWIPCSDRLPEPFENVLVSTKEGGRAIAHRCPNQAYGRYYDLHSSAIENVTAWMPLPEPYHES